MDERSLKPRRSLVVRRHFVVRFLYHALLLTSDSPPMKHLRLFAFALLLPLFMAGCTSSSDEPMVTVYKTPTCGCCSLWVDHLKANGFSVQTYDLDDLSVTKAQLGVPGNLSSCHTAVVGGYVVEGHVPAEDVKRLLAERPNVTGLAVPGMPIGSPGMEVEGRPNDRYQVVAFDKRGGQSVFATH